MPELVVMLYWLSPAAVNVPVAAATPKVTLTPEVLENTFCPVMVSVLAK